MSEIDVIAPTSVEVTLSSGTTVELEELRLRQFLRLLRIITEGTPDTVLVGGLQSLAEDGGKFAANLLMLVMLGIPNAEDAVVNFLLSMVRPKGLIGGLNGKPRSKMTKQETERDNAKFDVIDRELANPTLEDTIILIEKIFEQSAKDFEALGKRLAAMMKVAEKAGMLKTAQTSSASNSSEESPEESTSSAQSMDGEN